MLKEIAVEKATFGSGQEGLELETGKYNRPLDSCTYIRILKRCNDAYCTAHDLFPWTKVPIMAQVRDLCRLGYLQRYYDVERTSKVPKYWYGTTEKGLELIKLAKERTFQRDAKKAAHAAAKAVKKLATALSFKEIPYTQIDSIELPKWPQCIIFGEQTTPEYADEVIRRIDSFFTLGYDGNDKAFIHAAKFASKYPLEEEYYDDFDEDRDRRWAGIDKYYEAVDAWRKKWGAIGLGYLHTGWISSSWIGGPNGWIHKDGSIAYANNIGKYPEVHEIKDELTRIAEAFPKLTFYVTLSSAEEDEEDAHSLVSFMVSAGKVSAIWPIPLEVALEEAHKAGAKTCMERLESGTSYFANRKEGVYTIGHIFEWAEKVFGAEEHWAIGNLDNASTNNIVILGVDNGK